MILGKDCFYFKNGRIYSRAISVIIRNKKNEFMEWADKKKRSAE